MNILKPYMVYSRVGGAAEGASLVFAHTAKEARKIAWKEISWIRDICDNEWIDLATSKLNPEPWIMKQSVSTEPHIIEVPETCYDCLLWGFELDEKGFCEDCQEEYK